ncbi:MAG: glycosyltransferase family 2 protein [Desulfobacterales bacterium]
MEKFRIPPHKKNSNVRSSARGTFAIVIPLYNHGPMIGDVTKKALKLNLPVIVVNDGSTDAGCDRVARGDGIQILHHQENRGKGAAILTGFARASEIADWAITIDADGQHDPEDALHLIEAISGNSRPIVVGMRQGMAGKHVPWTSRFGREFSNFWVRLSGGPRLTDSQSGFRIYPLPEAMNLGVIARRFQFEVEILVRAAWTNIPVIEVPIRVRYGKGSQRMSHFRPFVDFLRNTRTFYQLITRRLLIHTFTRKR